MKSKFTVFMCTFLVALCLCLVSCNKDSGGVVDNSQNVGCSNSQSDMGSNSQAQTDNQDTGKIKDYQKIDDSSILVTFYGKNDQVDLSKVVLTGFNLNWRNLARKESKLEYTQNVVSVDSETFTVKFTLGQAFDYEKQPAKVIGKNYTQQDKDKILTQASNMVTWQIPNNGGWDKDYSTHANQPHTEGTSYITKGWKANGYELGTIDNSATYSEMAVIAEAYAISGEQKYKDSFLKGLEFINKLQGPNGGLRQVYPKRNNYSDYITLNDDAMANVMFVLHDILIEQYPYNTDLLGESERKLVKEIFDKGIEFLLKSQITLSDGTPTAWCAQHDPVTYKPMPARAYELASISGSESMGAIRLLALVGKPETLTSAKNALEWFDSVKLENTGFNNKSTTVVDGKIAYFYPENGKNTWYRFYSLTDGSGFFSDRDGKVYLDIADISAERREGYSWAGTWPQKTLDVYKECGVYTNGIRVELFDDLGVVSSCVIG